ncbi:phosphoenolpyruvate--protein phosphotransferase [Caproiciproducens sp.]
MKMGIGVSKGYAVGTAFVVGAPETFTFNNAGVGREQETQRLRRAIRESEEELKEIIEKARLTLCEKDIEIMESHIGFLSDPEFTGKAFAMLQEEPISAEKAVSDVTQSLSGAFSAIEDEYMKERGADIRDVGNRILRNLSGGTEKADFSNLPYNTVLVAHDLKPSETVTIDSGRVAAIVTEVGGKTSHTAILAKGLGIAAVVGCAGILEDLKTGTTVAVNGESGQVLISPDESTVLHYRGLAEQYERKNQRACSTEQIFTGDGRKIAVKANIGGINDLKSALENGADGVGLFRTEFLYMEKTRVPTEEEQFSVYKEAALLLEGKPLTIRTLDAGGDKDIPSLDMEKEQNPFLGVRAIRLCLKKPELFRVQLRAVLRASHYGNVQVMFPMIGSLRELEAAKKILRECSGELEREGIPFDRSMKVGMMIEVPSAAIIAADFASNVDFFSIGTNDLTQYTLAADRLNENVSNLYDPMHPAVLHLIRSTIHAAHKASIPCCMCGELASDEKAIPLLLEYGLDEFSVSPGILKETKSILMDAVGCKA